MDDRQTFDRRCLEANLELHVIVKAIGEGLERGDLEAIHQLSQLKANLIAKTLDYLYEHWDYMDEPTQKGWLDCAAQLPVMTENLAETNEDEVE